MLRIRLDGPDDLEALDRIDVEIRDDRPNRGASLPAAGPTAEQVAAVVWGPYRIMHGQEGSDTIGRRITVGPLPVGEDVPIALDRSVRPSWYAGGMEGWRAEYDDTSVRLTLTAWRGAMSWTTRLECPVEPAEDGGPGTG